ncbi:MAG: hypothetical protein HY961_07270 [Ignavibacteriae bacterium]|nr:hypothetical protein [Ignavibacteriota bacterium]
MHSGIRSLLVLLSCSLSTLIGFSQDQWRDTFPEDSAFVSAGRNSYFVLEPGFRLVLKGKEKGASAKLVITVLEETKVVDGVETRVVEERESVDGALVEVSRNFFAVGKQTKNIYYFGEEVDMYREGKVVSHEGAWQSGVRGARYGLMMPADPLRGSRFYQEVAPDVALDRAEVISTTEAVKTAAGRFKNCLKVEETTPLEPDTKEAKLYAKNIGLIRDGSLSLVEYGFEHK